MSAWWSTLIRRRNAVRQMFREAELILLLQIGVFASLVPLLMRLKFARVERLLRVRQPSRRASSWSPDAIVKHLQLARRIGSPVVGSGCLTRGVTLYYFLRRAGIDVTLSFGVRQIGEEFIGHCWLVRGGVPFLEDQDPRPLYVQTVSMPSQ
jgi:transglutaminase superfamily protein